MNRSIKLSLALLVALAMATPLLADDISGTWEGSCLAYPNLILGTEPVETKGYRVTIKDNTLIIAHKGVVLMKGTYTLKAPDILTLEGKDETTNQPWTIDGGYKLNGDNLTLSYSYVAVYKLKRAKP
jgi:hypothetical protein